jgi:hypothetical protein
VEAVRPKEIILKSKTSFEQGHVTKSTHHCTVYGAQIRCRLVFTFCLVLCVILSGPLVVCWDAARSFTWTSFWTKSSCQPGCWAGLLDPVSDCIFLVPRVSRFSFRSVCSASRTRRLMPFTIWTLLMLGLTAAHPLLRHLIPGLELGLESLALRCFVVAVWLITCYLGRRYTVFVLFAPFAASHCILLCPAGPLRLRRRPPIQHSLTPICALFSSLHLPPSLLFPAPCRVVWWIWTRLIAMSAGSAQWLLRAASACDSPQK